jgi:hypothetical protein
MGQHIDENRGLVSPQPFGLGRGDDLRTGEPDRCRRAVVTGAIFRGLRHPVLAAKVGGGEDNEA